MKKWKKILISLITVFVLAILPAESAILPGTVCVTEAAPRISSSKLTDPYEILTQKDASEIANDTLDMAVPYWADLLKGSGITLAVTARGVVLSAASQPIPLILPNSFLIRASCLSAQQPARNSGLLPQHASASLPERSPSSVLFGSWIPDPF